MATILSHLTLNDGRLRPTPRSDILDSVLAKVRAWIMARSNNGRYQTLPVPNLDEFVCKVSLFQGALLATLAGTRRATADTPVTGSALVPLLTFAVATDAAAAEKLWPFLQQLCPEGQGPQPPLPWCVRVLGPEAESFPGAGDWIPDFERCVAWAWIDLCAQPAPTEAPATSPVA